MIMTNNNNIIAYYNVGVYKIIYSIGISDSISKLLYISFNRLGTITI